MSMAYAFENWAAGVSLNNGETNLLASARLFRQDAATVSSGFHVDFDVAESRSPHVLALLNHDFAALPGALATVLASDDAEFGGTPLTLLPNLPLSPVGHRRFSHAFCLSTQVPPERRYYRIVVTFTGGGTRTVHLGGGFAGPVVDFGRGLSLGASDRLAFAVQQTRTFQGERVVSALAFHRSCDVKLDEASDEESAQLRLMHRRGLGGARPLLWLPRYAQALREATDCVYGRLGVDFAWKDGVNRGEVTPFAIEGVTGALP